MKKISYLVLCGALLGGVMESWGANVDFGFNMHAGKNGLAAINNASPRVPRNGLEYTDGDAGFMDKAGGGTLSSVGALYDAMYPGANILGAGGGNAHGDWFINDTAVDLGGGAAAALTPAQKQYFMKKRLDAVFQNGGLDDFLLGLAERAAQEEFYSANPLGDCVPANADGIETAKDACVKKFVECLAHFNRAGLYDAIVEGVRSYITNTDIDVAVFKEEGLKDALKRIDFGAVGANIAGNVDRNTAAFVDVVDACYDANGVLDDSFVAEEKVRLDDEKKEKLRNLMEGSKKRAAERRIREAEGWAAEQDEVQS